MSLCLGIQFKNQVFIGSDSRLFRKGLRIGDDAQKLRFVHGKLIFGAGVYDIFCRTIAEYAESTDTSIENLRDIAKRWTDNFIREVPQEIVNDHLHNGQLMLCVMTVFELRNGLPFYTHIKGHQNFNIEEHDTPQEDGKVNWFLSGFYDSNLWDFVEECMEKQLSPQELIRETFKKAACDQVGGRLSAYIGIDTQFLKLLEEKII